MRRESLGYKRDRSPKSVVNDLSHQMSKLLEISESLGPPAPFPSPPWAAVSRCISVKCSYHLEISASVHRVTETPTWPNIIELLN